MKFLKNPLPLLFLFVAFACQEETEVTGDPLKSMKIMLAGAEGKTKDWKLVTAERFKYNGSAIVQSELAQCDYDNLFRFTNINWSSVNTVSYVELRGNQSCTESEAEIMESGAWDLSKSESGEVTLGMLKWGFVTNIKFASLHRIRSAAHFGTLIDRKYYATGDQDILLCRWKRDQLFKHLLIRESELVRYFLYRSQETVIPVSCFCFMFKSG